MRDGDEIEVVLTGVEFKRVGEKQTPMCELMAKNDEGEELKVAIFLTEKSAGIARQQFKKCGFLIDEQPLSSLKDWIAKAERRVMVTIETREYGGNLYYQGAIEVGDRARSTLPKDDLDEMTRWMRNVKKRDEDAPKGEARQPSRPAPAPARTSAPSRSGQARRGGDDVNFDDIPFSFIIAMLTLVGGTMLA